MRSAVQIRPVWLCLPLIRATLLAAAAFDLGLAPALGAEESKAPGLRYGWKQGQTYMFRVHIEVDRGDYVEVLSGNPSYNVLSSDKDAIKFTFHGTLQESRQPKPGKNVVYVSPPRVRPPFSPFQGVGSGGLARTHEITINPFGEIVSMQGSSQLPFLLGNLSELMLVLLPEGNKKTWGTTHDVAITLSNGMFPRLIFREDDRQQIKAVGKTTYTLEKITADTATLRKTHELRTTELVNGKPRFEVSGRGLVTFDLKRGTPTAMDFTHTLTAREGTVAEELGLKISCKLLSEAEVAQVKQAEEEARKEQEAKQREAAKPFEAQELAAALADLTSTDQLRMLRALTAFQNKKPVAPSAEVAKTLESLLSSDNVSTRVQAARALENWATTDSVATLVNALADSNVFVRKSAMNALARVAPVEGAELIASRMAEVSDRFNAAAALKSIGAPAEPAVRKMLSHQEWQVRLEAVNVLKEIGTKASIDALKPLSETDDFILVKQMAAQAIEAIQKRDK
jgi:hypothetical protein